MTGELDGLVPIWTFDCSSSRLFPVYVPLHSNISQFKQCLRQETQKEGKKKEKQDFLIWNGKLMDTVEGSLPVNTTANKAIISLGMILTPKGNKKHPRF